jgi:hypothetical protein
MGSGSGAGLTALRKNMIGVGENLGMRFLLHQRKNYRRTSAGIG